ncbi:hypothetical protein IV500_12935 [Paeniglutamicibacter antarcticus]|uniref:Uncharacterized protein n=1 Tax=Arthrobacter terrae TaxID=2935737 RepID=A0A931CQJ1_9MICC|nr:hypothetical protein [Arthrobacter terrae]MBG0740286.1 hypothetical protein [Arthrobacter terrae]
MASAEAQAAEWDRILDRLEEQLTGSDVPWHPPADAGPIPVELMERARRLLADQHAAVEHLEVQQRQTMQHLTAIQSVPESAGAGRPVFLDVTG